MHHSHLHHPHLDHLQSPASGITGAQQDSRWVTAILVATVSYQAILCLLNSHGLTASRALLGMSEGIILCACLPIIARRMLPGVIVAATFAGAMFCFLAIVGGQLNIKTLRDLAIPLCYFWLGCNLGQRDIANRALMYAIAVVLVMGAFELFFLDSFTDLFNIYRYYVNTGNLEPITTYVNNSKLQLNGMRPEGIGRTLFPSLLGNHRVSSVFLEPVSLGNFATICAAWGLSMDKPDIKKTLFFVFVALVMIVISDSRFAITSVFLMIGMRLLLRGKALYLPILGPFAAIILLLLLGDDASRNLEDSFRGRLALSGHALLGFDMPKLFAADISNPFADMGYAHLISSFGLPLALVLWFSIWLLPMPDERGQRFRAFAAIYISLILCVSGYSLYALKTSGILWFLIGCCLKNPAPVGDKRVAFFASRPAAPVYPVSPGDVGAAIGDASSASRATSNRSGNKLSSSNFSTGPFAKEKPWPSK